MRTKMVMLTGAAGYIGSVLTAMLLDAGYEVLAVDRFFFGRHTLPSDHPRLRTLQADIRWLDETVFVGVGAVIDLAAMSNDPAGELDPEKTLDVNYRGRVRVAQLACRAGVERYILPSSCSLYGFQDGVVDETSKVKPLTTYALANYRAEQGVLPLAQDGFCVTVLRQATVYGLSPRMRFDLAINGMARGLHRDGSLPILRDGTQWRPFVHVRDTSRAIMSVLEAPARLINGETFNVGSDDQNCQIMPLARTVAEAMGLPFRFEWYGAPDHRSYRVSFAKVRRALGFQPGETPETGAREVHEALRDGLVDADDPRTITVTWYKHLLEMHALLKDLELEGVLL